jgi:predicted AlkP superfamily pyrophosphatase or phosphodiesterase
MILFCQLVYAGTDQYKTVVIVSIDALHPNAVSEVSSPNIYNIIKKGVYSPDAVSTNPPKTLISHSAMLTGLSPEKNGKKDNSWKKGEPKVVKPTMLTKAKEAGYETVLIYSKSKLGYLGNNYTDKEIYSRDDAIEKATSVLDTAKKQFVFLHISGLDFVGPESGWLSADYMDELNFIDEQLGAFLNKLFASPSYLLVITSDHAGHEKIHGSDHPEDFKRPLAVYSSVGQLSSIPKEALSVEGLRSYIESIYLK